MTNDRESIELDVVFVGAGPAGLSGAVHLATLVKRHNELVEDAKLAEQKLDVSIAVIEKGREVGAHALSGAVIDPRALRELIPDFEQKGAPLESPVREDHVWFLTSDRKWEFPIVPAPLRNHGNYIASLGKLVKWLAAIAEQLGVDVFPEFSATELLIEDGKVVGLRAGDKGVDKQGAPKANYEPGVDIRAKVTVLGEGPRGTLAKVLIEKFSLDCGRNPQVYSVGIKELWELAPGRVFPGTVIHTLGFPLDRHTFGGGFLYAGKNNLLSLGLVVGLSYEDPALDPHLEFQRFKTHPAVAGLLKEGKLIRYGAKALPEGGYYSMPKPYVNGALIVGDSAGFLNSQRLKGIHLAMKSGMLAAETIYEALRRGDFSEQQLGRYEALIRSSWVNEELYRVRNFHQAMERGLWAGSVMAGLQMITGGRGFTDPMSARPGHLRMKKLTNHSRNQGAGEQESREAEEFKPDGVLTFDKLTDVYYSGTSHDENQPCHLRVSDFDICHTRCTVEYGNPCQHFCPAAVYEMIAGPDGSKRLQINASNCVHCKTCDIMDPYQIITWVPPEGGGGPNYVNL